MCIYMYINNHTKYIEKKMLEKVQLVWLKLG